MTTDLRTVLDRAAGETPRPDTDAIVRRGRTLRRRRQALTAVAAVALPLAIVAIIRLPLPGVQFAGDPSGEGSVLELPPAGDVAAVHLDDGTPVFVVHESDGTVHVIDTRNPYETGRGVDLRVGWCTTSRTFEDLSFGSRFQPDGGYLGGPAPTGLATYAVGAAGEGRVQVSARRPGAAREASGEYEPHGPACELVTEEDAERFLAHHRDEAALSPAEALAAGEGTRVLLEGVVELVDGQPARLCSPRGETVPTCTEADPLVHGLSRRTGEDPDMVVALHGRMLATVSDGGFRDITATALAGWDVRAFRGEVRSVGALLPFPPTEGPFGMSSSYYHPTTPDEEPGLVLLPAGSSDDYEALYLSDDVEVLGGAVLAGSEGPTPIHLDALLDAVHSGRVDGITFAVETSKVSGLVVRITEQPSP